MASSNPRELDSNDKSALSQEKVKDLIHGQTLDIDFFNTHIDEESDEPEYLENNTHLSLILEKSFEQLREEMETIHPHVKKKVIKAGIYNLIPPNATVTIQYEGYFENQKLPFDSTFDRKKPYRVQADCEDLFEGMQIALQSMRLEETAHFLMDYPVVYGEYSFPGLVPPKADLFAVIHVMKVDTEKNLTSDDLDGIMHEAEKLLVAGKRQFVINGQGAHHLRKAVEMLDKCKINEDKEQQQLNEIKLRILSNLCGMYNRTNHPEMAIVQAREALLLDPRSEKALLAMAEGHTRLKNFKTAIEFLKRGMKFHPQVLAFKDELKKLSERKLSTADGTDCNTSAIEKLHI